MYVPLPTPKKFKVGSGVSVPRPLHSSGTEKFKVGFRVEVTLGDVPQWVDVGGWLRFDYDSSVFNSGG